MFYLMTHSTHLFYGYMAFEGKGTHSARQDTHCCHFTGYLTLSKQQQEIFYMHHPTNMIVHNMAFVTPVVEHWLEREITQWVHQEGSIQWLIAPEWSTLLMCVCVCVCVSETEILLEYLLIDEISTQKRLLGHFTRFFDMLPYLMTNKEFSRFWLILHTITLNTNIQVLAFVLAYIL